MTKRRPIWADEIGMPSSRIERMGESDNFWPANAPSQGPDGVCGPCSEIFYQDDFGEVVEIWNLVFTQFHRVGDPPDNLRPLPSRNIDTGMGLERTAAVLQGVSTNYHIDTLRPIVEAAADVCGQSYQSDHEYGRRFRRIADHVRACTFAIHEKVYPGPRAEKYVIRRLLRRAVLDGRQMGVAEPFLHKIVPAVVEMIAAALSGVAGDDRACGPGDPERGRGVLWHHRCRPGPGGRHLCGHGENQPRGRGRQRCGRALFHLRHSAGIGGILGRGTQLHLRYGRVPRRR